jgi:peptidoglycan/xylan/chitin deacetylase (PgdA/CDA1 family)
MTALVIVIGLLLMDAVAIALWYAVSLPRSRLLGPVVLRGRSDRKLVALTFDDGPGTSTTRVLDILAASGVKATFFVCGQHAEEFPEVLRRIAAEGHTIGNHGYSHEYLYFKSATEIAAQIDRTQKIISDSTGKVPWAFRSPYGSRWFPLPRLLRERDMRLVHWSVTAYDWLLPAEAIVRAATRNLQNGDIILLHDGEAPAGGYLNRFSSAKTPPVPRDEFIAALPEIILRIRASGFELATLDQLL